ncbi:hypothetical protein ACOSQ2_009302 [Xanthoceras sorbifolium]
MTPTPEYDHASSSSRTEDVQEKFIFDLVPRPSKYDVFLSFRGEDVREKFISHLLAALCQKNIKTFIDDQLKRGEEISPSLVKATEESKLSVVVFSKGYATSTWCLDELVQIIECKREYEQAVIPVFYEVDPSDVRNQTGSFADAFAEYEERYKDKANRWRAALIEASNLSGWDSRKTRPESVLIETIVKDVLRRLNDLSSSDSSNLVGIDSRIQEIESLMCIGSKDVCSIGLWGIGGIGKTTLAGAVFGKISCQFEGSYFIHNVREESERSGGLNYLQRELLSTILGDRSARLGNTFTKNRFRRKKLLIVFDDVTSFRQIESLIGDLDCFGSGSRIIITTRDKQVLKICKVDQIYKVEELIYYDAVKLFCRYAFRQNHPKVGYEQLSNRIVEYVGGVPLALKVLGSCLFDKTEEVWKSAVNKLQKNLDKDIQQVLKISYDGLDYDEQNIFLDIACFFKGWDIDIVKEFLNASGFYTEIGISDLIDKSLITISENITTMHDLLQAIGRKIVHQESIDNPGKRSRLWYHEDIYRVLKRNTVTETVMGISLDMSKIRDVHVKPDTFSKMHKLRFLKFYSARNGENDNKVHAFQGSEYVSDELRYLHWHNCPLRSLQSNFNPENLVVLNMPHSNVEQLWNGVQQLPNLKEINLEHSKHLTIFPDLFGAVNLESLNLQGCTNLLELPVSIQCLNNLKVLKLTNCKSLEALPNCTGLESLRQLDLMGCSNVKTLSGIPCNIEILELCGTGIEQVPSSIEYLSRLLRYLHWHNCPLRSLQSNFNPENLVVLNMPHSNVEQLWNGGQQLPNLKEINLEHSKHLTIFPDLFGAVNLESLNLQGCTNLFELPVSIQCLNNLKVLKLTNCKSLEALPNCSGLESLRQLDLMGCSNVKTLSGIPCNIEILELCGTGIEQVPASIEYLRGLVILNLNNCSSLMSLPSSICKLKSLERLYLSGCLKLDKLPDNLGDLQSLTLLVANETAIREVPSSMVHLDNLETLSFTGCKGQETVGLVLPPLSGLHGLIDLDLVDCGLMEIPDSLGQLSSLRRLSLGRNSFESLPTSIINLSNLVSLDVSYCEKLQFLPELPWTSIYAHNCTSLEALSCLSIVDKGKKEDNIPQEFPCNMELSFISFCFINCFKLDQNLLRDFVEDTLLKIQRGMEECLYKGSNETSSALICCPGSEIPNWFEFQSTGSFIIMELSPGWFSKKFVGFALCIIVAIRDHLQDRQGLAIECECKLQSEDGREHVICGTLWGWPLNGPECIGSDHMFLGCDYQMYPYDIGISCYTNVVSIHFHIKDTLYYKCVEFCEVKKCGVRLMYSQDLGEPGGSFSSNDDDEFWESIEKLSGSFDSDDEYEFWESMEEPDAMFSIDVEDDKLHPKD